MQPSENVTSEESPPAQQTDAIDGFKDDASNRQGTEVEEQGMLHFNFNALIDFSQPYLPTMMAIIIMNRNYTEFTDINLLEHGYKAGFQKCFCGSRFSFYLAFVDLVLHGVRRKYSDTQAL